MVVVAVEVGVPQCGYCQSGQLMAAAALLERRKNPTDREIDQAMAGNICRCGTYNRVRAAILQAAGVADSDLKITHLGTAGAQA